MTKIEAIAESAADNLRRLIVEAQEEISTAMIKCAEEAQLQEKEAVFRLGFSVVLNLDTNKMKQDLSWTIKRTLGVEDDIPNPDQLKFSISE